MCFHVVRIIDEYQVVISGGTADGIIRGTILEIFSDGDSLIDPVTGEDLGKIDTILATIRVKRPYERFSICVNNETMPSIIDAFQAATALTSGRLRELPVDVSDMEGLPGYNRKIKTRDKVRVISTPQIKSANQIESTQEQGDGEKANT